MKIIATFLITFCLCFSSYAQNNFPVLTNKGNVIYAVQHCALLEMLGDNHPVVYATPKYKKGLFAIKQFFKEVPTLKFDNEELVLTVYISFIVNSHGKASTFKILGQSQSPSSSEVATGILDKLNNMPNQWEPGYSFDKKIDSYQVLEFIVVQGAVQSINYW